MNEHGVGDSRETDEETLARLNRAAALSLDLVGGYIDGNAARVAKAVEQITAYDAVDNALFEATRFAEDVATHRTAFSADDIRQAVLTRLKATVPLEQDVAISAALDHCLAGRFDQARDVFGQGDAGNLAALHVIAAYTAMLGLHTSEPGEFTSGHMAYIAELVSYRRMAE